MVPISLGWCIGGLLVAGLGGLVGGLYAGNAIAFATTTPTNTTSAPSGNSFGTLIAATLQLKTGATGGSVPTLATALPQLSAATTTAGS